MKSYVSLFGIQIPLYGVCFFGGILAAAVVAGLLVRKQKMDFFDFLCSLVYTLIGALLGAKLLFIVVSFEEIIRLKLSFLEIMQGGFVFYGGLLGGAAGLLIYIKQFKEDAGKYLDLYAAVLPLGHAFGRMGCFFAGCCYGIHYDGFGACVYEQCTNISTPLGVGLLPVQLIESFFLFVLFGVLMFLYLKKKQTGNLALLYLIAYSVLRFTLEFFRGDVERGVFLNLSTSQWISILLLVLAVALLIRKSRKKA